MGRILKFNSDKADELIAKMKEEIAEIDNHLAHIVDYTVNWYQMLKNKYGKNFLHQSFSSFEYPIASPILS